MTDCEYLVLRLRDRARDEDDLRAASMLEKLEIIRLAARDVVKAKTHEQSMAAYAELVDIFQGKSHD